ncbi:MAG: response regulator transcription factor [Armatimonadetes bacterium]|nr:response regulator transcription factor [Armatimonadota bacterium]MDW8121915.1 response regulator transcription factor [Armatimonadota bacterium]
MTTSPRTILLVEDEAPLAAAVEYALKKEGFFVKTVHNGQEALRLALKQSFDLIILDLMLPGLDGWQVCRAVRAKSAIPILILTARGEEDDRVLGFELGADDYVVKPFSIKELIARIRAILRRSAASDEGTTSDAVIKVGNLTLDPREWTAFLNDRPLALTPREFALLHTLVLNVGKVLSRQYLLERVWGHHEFIDQRTVDVHIRWLREKIEENPSEPTRIVTVRGIGYKFVG